MSSFKTKRCFASAGVVSTGSDTDSVALGGRDLVVLHTAARVRLSLDSAVARRTMGDLEWRALLGFDSLQVQRN